MLKGFWKQVSNLAGRLWDRTPMLVRFLVVSAAVGVLLYFILPSPSDAVMLILCLCAPLGYLIYRIYSPQK